MIHLEHDYQGQDYSVNVKALNPSPADLTGMYIGSYLQSVTKNLALGVESLYQRAGPDMTDVNTSWLAKYTGSNKDWIATAQLAGSGIVQATYWQKFGDKVEAAADLQLVAAPQRRDAIATLGLKYDLRMSTFRAQVDSTGKVSALLEQRFAPTFAFTVGGEIDHFKVIRFFNMLCVQFANKNTEHCPCGHGCDDRKLFFNTRGDGDASATPDVKDSIKYITSI